MTPKVSALPVEFDLRESIRDAINSGMSDPYKIAKRLCAAVPPDMVRDFVELRIVEVCRAVMSQTRIGSFITYEKDSTLPIPDRHRMATSCVAVPGRGFIRHCDMTAEDCDAVADERDAMSLGLRKESKRFRRLSEAIKKHKVKTVGELPEIVRMDILK